MELYQHLIKTGFVPTLFFAFFPINGTELHSDHTVTFNVLHQQWKNDALGSTTWHPVHVVNEAPKARFDEQTFS